MSSKFYTVDTEKPKEVKLNLILMGQMSVGKTSILECHKNLSRGLEPGETLSTVKSTMSPDLFIFQRVIDEIKVNLRICDTAGQERLRNSMPITYFRGLHGCILVYDITDTNSFNALNQLKDDTLLWSSPEDAEHFPLILLGNKCDLSEDKKVSERRIRLWCDENKIPHLQVSALDGTNIEAAFDLITDLALKYYFDNFHQYTAEEAITLNTDKPKKKFWTCNC